MELLMAQVGHRFSGRDDFPPCISRIMAMRIEKPTRDQSFHLACWLLNNGYGIEECKQVFKGIFQEDYVEETADTDLKLIKLKDVKPYSCFIVRQWLGVCSPNCPRYKTV